MRTFPRPARRRALHTAVAVAGALSATLLMPGTANAVNCVGSGETGYVCTDNIDSIYAPAGPVVEMTDTGETLDGVPTASTPSVGDNGSDLEGDVTASTAIEPCAFITDGDRVHISSSAFEASGHGWWRNINCKVTYARVRTQLLEQKNGTWYRVGTVGDETIRSGGGSGKWATGRAACGSANPHPWRSEIDVDLIGQPDSPEKALTPVVTVNCER